MEIMMIGWFRVNRLCKLERYDGTSCVLGRTKSLVSLVFTSLDGVTPRATLDVVKHQV